MNKQIISTIRPILDYIIILRIKLDGYKCEMKVGELREELIELLENTELKLSTISKLHDKTRYIDNDNEKVGRRLSKKIDVVMYILAALLDDVVARSKWANNNDDNNKWLSESSESAYSSKEPSDSSKKTSDFSLEFSLFNRSLIGNEFNIIAEKEGPYDSEMAELFYIALNFGFYKHSDLKNKVYGWISDKLPDDDRFLSPRAEIAAKGRNNRLPYIFGFWIFIIVLIVSLISYGYGSKRLWDDAASIIHKTANQLIIKRY